MRDSPESGIFAAVTSTVTSSAFLSLSIGTAWSTICLIQKYLPNSFLPTKRFYLQVRSPLSSLLLTPLPFLHVSPSLSPPIPHISTAKRFVRRASSQASGSP